ncbi:MAG: HNH endonuclease [Bacteroidales bacterium]|nr:HNH endonuclease [Bacteroidales bacterium]
MYELNLRHRNISENDIIVDLQLVAKKYNNDYLSPSEYKRYGKYSIQTIRRRFGSWEKALKKAKLKGTTYRHIISNEDFINDVKEVAKKLNQTTISYCEYKKYGKFCIDKAKQFGGWNCVLHYALLEPTPHKLGIGKTISDNDLLLEIESMWIKLGRQPTATDVKNKLSRYSLNTYTRRFGSWNRTLIRFAEFINNDNNYREEYIEQKSQNSEEVITKHTTKREPSNRLKVQVLMRDGNRCRLCGIECNDGIHNIHFDHIIPWSKGGETVLENLQVLCSKCNLAKGNCTNE